MERTLYGDIVAAYGFTIVTDNDSSPLGESVSSTVVQLETKDVGTVVVKESNWYQFLTPAAAKQALEMVYTVSEQLRAGGVSIPKAYQTPQGSFVCEVGGKFYVVQERLQGGSFTHSDEHIFSLGQTLARFHSVGRTLLAEHPQLSLQIQDAIPTEKSYEDSHALYDDVLKAVLVSEHPCTLPEVCGAVKNDLAFIETCMERVDTVQVTSEAFTQTILHNDLNTRNILFTGMESFGQVIDIDQLGVGSCILDIANTLNSFTWKFVEENPACIPEKTALYLRGYQSVLPLLAAEYLAIIPAGLRWDLLRILRSLRRHHFEDNRFPELTANITKRFLPRLHKTAEQFSFITPAWLEEQVFTA